MRAQLKFLEELDKVERKRHEEQERETLMKVAKSRAKIEDPEQAKLKAKAKEVNNFFKIFLVRNQFLCNCTEILSLPYKI